HPGAAAEPVRRSALLREFERDRQRPHDAGRGAVFQGGEPRPPRAREGGGLSDLPQPVPGERRRDEAVRALRQVPRPRVSGEARPRAAPRDAPQPESLKAAARAAVAAGLTAYILWRSHP